MLIRRQDLGVLLFHYCGYAKIRNFILCRQHKPITRFVYFHDIPSVALDNFKFNLNFLKRKTNVISFDDFTAGKLSTERINVVITFDDGFKSWIERAIPILRKLALPATFFISAGFVGLSKENETAFIQDNLQLKQLPKQRIIGGLTCDDVKMIADQGFTIGGHTLNHCNLSALRDKAKIKYEITEDKLILEKIINKKISYFSYPFGSYHNPDINITEILRNAGYTGAVTTTTGFNDNCTNPYLLHRESTDAGMHASVFKSRVYGNYDAVRFFKKMIRHHKRQKTDR